MANWCIYNVKSMCRSNIYYLCKNNFPCQERLGRGKKKQFENTLISCILITVMCIFHRSLYRSLFGILQKIKKEFYFSINKLSFHTIMNSLNNDLCWYTRGVWVHRIGLIVFWRIRPHVYRMRKERDTKERKRRRRKEWSKAKQNNRIINGSDLWIN